MKDFENVNGRSKEFFHMTMNRGVAANNGLGGWGGGRASSNRDLFSVVSTNVVKKSLMFLHRVNNIEHDIKQNIYTGMEFISLIPL